MAFLNRIWDRTKAMVFSPAESWEIVKLEDSNIQELLRDYILPGALIPTTASFIGRWIVGISIPFWGVFHFSFFASLLIAVLEYVFWVLWIWLADRLILFMAGRFDSLEDETSAMKLSVFSVLPFWVAGAINIIPALHLLVMIFGLYCLYLLFLGLPLLMETPADKVLPFVLVVVAGVLLTYAIGTAILSGITGAFGPDFHR
jgi:hypothetical protein